MKRLFAAALLALSSIAFGATLNPVQLLNPAGSTAGQAVVSTGASTAPGWANVPVANVTGAAPLASPTFTGTVTLPATTTITTPNIVGVTNGGAAAAGSVGQVIQLTGTAVSLTTGVPVNCTSIPLTAGDWDVTGNVQFNPAGSTVTSFVLAGINTVSATLPASYFQTALTTSAAVGTSNSAVAPTQPINVSTTTTAFLVAEAGFSTSTETATCVIVARRRR